MESKLYIDSKLDISILTSINSIEKTLNNGKIVIKPIQSNSLLFKIIVMDTTGEIKSNIAVKKYLNIEPNRLHFIGHTSNIKLLNYVIGLFSKTIAYKLNLKCIIKDIGTYKHYYIKDAGDADGV